MDRDHFGQIWPSSLQKWARKALVASAVQSLYWGSGKSWLLAVGGQMVSQINPKWVLMLSQHKMRWVWAIWGPPKPSGTLPEGSDQHWNLGRVKMTNRVVHEKSVKMQLLQILRAIKPRVNIWIEIILAKYDRPQVKNEREHPVVHLRSRHYMEKR